MCVLPYTLLGKGSELKHVTRERVKPTRKISNSMCVPPYTVLSSVTVTVSHETGVWLVAARRTNSRQTDLNLKRLTGLLFIVILSCWTLSCLTIVLLPCCAALLDSGGANVCPSLYSPLLCDRDRES